MRLFQLMGLAGLILMGGCGTVGTKTPARGPDAFHSHLGAETVALITEIEDKDDETGVVTKHFHTYCTGVWVSKDEILTAGHCAEGIARKESGTAEDDETVVDPVHIKVHYLVEGEVDQVGSEPTGTHLGEIKAWDEEHDLALIKALGKMIPRHISASLVTELPGVGERVFCVGHPQGLYWTYVEGAVSAYREELPSSLHKGPYIQINASVYFGNSGGGAFDSSGRLLGIASTLAGRQPNMAIYVHPDNIRKFLGLVEKKVIEHKEQAGL